MTDPKSEPSELLPCPFCGHVGLDFAEGSTFRWLAYSCGSCGMGSETRVQTLGTGSHDEWTKQAKEAAAEAWNTRVALTPAPAQPEPPTDEQLRDIFREVSPGQLPASVLPYWPGLKAFARAVSADEFERGRQQGMKQERALWKLAAEGQAIEAQPPTLTDAQCDAIHFGLSEWAKDIDARMGLPRPDSKSRALIRAAAAGGA